MKSNVMLGFAGLLAWLAGYGASLPLGDIPYRPVPPEWPYERFYRVQPIVDLGFSPDNRRLYFVRGDGEVDNVFFIDLTDPGGSLHQVTHFSDPVEKLVIGRRGRYLYVTHDVGGNEQFNIYRVSLASGDVEALTHSPPADKSYICGFSPDGRFMYFGQSHGGRAWSDLWRMDVDSGTREQVLASHGRLLECGGVSRDGRYLVFYHFVVNGERHLGLVDLREHTERYIFRQPQVNNINAVFGGDSLYFMNAWRADAFQLWRYRLSSHRLTRVLLPGIRRLQSFSLYDDGRLAVFRYRAGLRTGTALFRNRSASAVEYRLPPGRLIDAVFSETDPAQAIFVTAAADEPERYFLFDGAKLRLIYDANESGIPVDQFSRAVSTWVRSFDGLPVPVHLFVPNGTSAQSPRPVILWLHGGPEAYVDPEFDGDFQYLTNHGFIVAAPNVRGSAGFGKWYAHLDDGDWGGGHVRDAIAVASFLKQLDFVDSRNIFVLGESFGGYSALEAITRYPDVFRGAIVFSGISELARFVSRLPQHAIRYLLGEMRFDPRQDRWRNIALSPYYHVDRIRIPVQIHQGRHDQRVTEAETRRLVEKLRARGLPVEYYVYEHEGHGFLRFADQKQAYERVLAFVKKYLARSVAKPIIGGLPTSARR